MGQPVKLVAQQCQDDFEGNYAAGTSFFTLQDYIVRVGQVAADFYRQGWQRQYDELRADGNKSKEVVGFDPTTLSEQLVKVKKNNDTGEWVGDIEKVAMSLPYDQQTSGYANVFDAKTGEELERSNIDESWQSKYEPYNNRKFFRIDRKQIKISTRGVCSIQEVRILHVPSIKIGDGDEELPDGIISYCITNTVAYMNQVKQGKIIKKTLDGNENIIPETEINKEAIK